MTREISNHDDIIDSREIVDRIQEIEDALGDTPDLVEDHDELRKELESLKKLEEQCEGVGDWAWGEALIRDEYFEEYAENLAHDLGLMTEDSNQWPYYCIDWEAAANDLKQDYIEVDFDGQSYWIRA